MSDIRKAAVNYILSELDPSDYVEMAPDALAIQIFLAGAACQRERDAEIVKPFEQQGSRASLWLPGSIRKAIREGAEKVRDDE